MCTISLEYTTINLSFDDACGNSKTFYDALGNVPHVYYMCDAHVCVVYLVYYTCQVGKYPTHPLTI